MSKKDRVMSDNRLFSNKVDVEATGEAKEKSESTNEMREVLKPLIKISRALGSWPKDGQQFILRLTLWNGFTLFILHFYTFHKFLNWMTVVKNTRNLFEVFEQLTLIFRTATVAVCFDIRFIRHSLMLKLLKSMEEYPTFNKKYSVISLKKRILSMIYICLFFIFMHILLASIFMFHTSTENYVNWLFYGESADKTPDAIIRTVMIADWALYLYLVICNECFLMATYIAICSLLLNKVRDYNLFLKNLEKAGSVQKASQIQELYQLHSRLSSIVEEVEDNLAFPAFLWVMCIIFNLAVKIEAIISGIKQGHFQEFGYIFTDATYYTIAFIALCLIASEVGEENSDPVVSVTKFAEGGDIYDLGFQQETQLLITKLNTRMLRLTGWNCFELNKKFLLTILGAMATYSIIILQMA